MNIIVHAQNKEKILFDIFFSKMVCPTVWRGIRVCHNYYLNFFSNATLSRGDEKNHNNALLLCLTSAKSKIIVIWHNLYTHYIDISLPSNLCKTHQNITYVPSDKFERKISQPKLEWVMETERIHYLGIQIVF